MVPPKRIVVSGFDAGIRIPDDNFKHKVKIEKPKIVNNIKRLGKTKNPRIKMGILRMR